MLFFTRVLSNLERSNKTLCPYSADWWSHRRAMRSLLNLLISTETLSSLSFLSLSLIIIIISSCSYSQTLTALPRRCDKKPGTVDSTRCCGLTYWCVLSVFLIFAVPAIIILLSLIDAHHDNKKDTVFHQKERNRYTHKNRERRTSSLGQQKFSTASLVQVLVVICTCINRHRQL